MLINLEQVWQHQLADLPAIVVIDFRVLAIKIQAMLCRNIVYTSLPLDRQRTLQWAYWACELNHPISFLANPPKAGWFVIVVDDFKRKIDKKYWRVDLYPDYKGNRNSETDRGEEYNNNLVVGRQYIEHAGFPYFSQESFEADDFAGLAARLKRAGLCKEQSLFLYTCDADWQQLVDDKYKILWANSLKKEPRLRSETEIIDIWKIQKPADIIQYKALYGDTGDNIKPLAPKEIIDLFDPPQTPDKSSFCAIMENIPLANTNPEHLRQAIKIIKKWGFLWNL